MVAYSIIAFSCDHIYKDTVVPPTCAKEGYTLHECTLCGLYYGDSYTAALGHSWSAWTVVTRPTGTTKGWEERTCERCNTNERRALAPTSNPFDDVKEKDYFFEPVLWAVQNGITNGTSATKFSPEAPCTRAQIVTLLWRAYGSPEPARKDNPFTDVKSNVYYYKAVLWAVEKGITTGISSTKFGPEATCTRGQVATFLWRAQGKPAPISSSNPFSDVKNGQYYYNAVLWAVENNVTQGTGRGKFSPEDNCTRGQIVTFLYRALVN